MTVHDQTYVIDYFNQSQLRELFAFVMELDENCRHVDMDRYSVFELTEQDYYTSVVRFDTWFVRTHLWYRSQNGLMIGFTMELHTEFSDVELDSGTWQKYYEITPYTPMQEEYVDYISGVEFIRILKELCEDRFPDTIETYDDLWQNNEEEKSNNSDS